MAAETVASARASASVDERSACYQRFMGILAGNTRFRLFLVCAALMSEGADKVSVNDAASAYSDVVTLE